MALSMTGYGRAKAVLNGRDITVEIKSVNSRYFEYSSRLPRSCAFLDDSLKKMLGASISRGKVELSLQMQSSGAQEQVVDVNLELARSYRSALRLLSDALDVKDATTVETLANLPDVLTVRTAQVDEEQLSRDVSAVCAEALQNFLNMRAVEGEKLRQDLLGKLDHLEEDVARVEQNSAARVEAYTQRLYAKLEVLLADRNHCKVLGDTTVVCWPENAGSAYADLGTMALFGIPADSGIQEEDVSRALALLAKGQACEFLEQTLLPTQHVYFLGLAPNAARISVRFFLQDSLAHFAAHIRAHEQALEIIRPSFDARARLCVWDLARETARRSSDGKYADPAPQLAGDLMRAVLSGGRYPATLLNGVTLRIRAEHEITRGKAAILKAYYTRNPSPLCPKEVLTVELNEQSTYCPYVLGRLFAVLEAVQDAANPGINTTIKDKYFSSACATPAVVFPTLVKLAQKHLQKLAPGSKIFYNQQLTDLMVKLSQPYPARMTLPEQGAFEIGYYHQTQKRYEKKDKEDESNGSN